MLAALAAAPASGAAAGSDGAAAVDDGAIESSTVAVAQADNETDRHRNPETYREAGDQEGLADALEHQLRRRLGSSTIEVSQGEYDLASEYVDDSFEEQLSNYVEVAGDTGREETAETFESARETQETLTDARRQYAETYEDYQAAREAGDEARARELARELEALAGEINASSASLADHYGAIEADTGADMSEPIDAAASVDEEVAATQADVRAQTFEETRLSVDAEAESISFSDPLLATGTLETDDGEPVGGETIRLDVGNRTTTVATDADGSFSFQYRPVSVPAAAESVSVTYVPENASAYLGSETSVAVSIDQETPAIEPPTVGADSVAFGDEASVETTVTVDGEPVPALPVVVRLGGETLGVLETDADGVVAGAVSIPATVPEGDRELTLAVPFENRALAGASASTAVTVAETTPDLSVRADATSDGDLAVNGTFAAAGAGVAGQSVAIAVDGEPVATATTDADGRFGAVVTIPDSADGDVTVTASTSGDGTNLEPVAATATVATAPQSAGGWPVGLPTRLVGGLGVVLAASVGGWWLWRRRRAGGDAELPLGEVSAASDDADAADRSGSAAAALLTRAQEELGSNRPDEAVRAAYGAVRRHLGAAGDDARTHWEFYRDREAAAVDAASLRDLTEDYERATFGPEPVDRSTAERALARARTLCDPADEGAGSGRVSSAD